MPRERRAYLLLLGSIVAVLFVAGIVWRALNPNASENPNEDAQIAARQDRDYLCLHRPAMKPADMYRLVVRKLPHDDPRFALRGCQEAQRP